MGRCPAEPWGIESLARHLNVSRAMLASGLLLEPGLTTSRIVARIGYG
jgi:hypothetical protein